MFKPKKETLIKIIIIMLLYMFIYDFYESLYRTHIMKEEQTGYNDYEIDMICHYPKFYDCETIIKIKNRCKFMQYIEKLNGCLINDTR